MRKSLCTLTVGVLLMPASFFLSAGDVKGPPAAGRVGIVDLDRVYRSHSKHPNAQKKIHELTQRLTGELSDLEGTMVELRSEFEKALKVMTTPDDQAKALAKLAQYYAADKKAREFWPKAQIEITKLTKELDKEIMDDIHKTVRTYAQKNGFTLVLPQPALYHAEHHLYNTDITSYVIRELRKK